MTKTPRNLLSLLGFFLVIGFIQLIGGLTTASEIRGWYATLEKAPWNPPSWVFGPVWTALYILIALAGWRLWNKLSDLTISDRMSAPALRFYFIQLLFNYLWSPLFFGLHQPALALTVILLMIIFLALALRACIAVDRLAFFLLLPYAAWLIYAASLNAAIVYLN